MDPIKVSSTNKLINSKSNNSINKNIKSKISSYYEDINSNRNSIILNDNLPKSNKNSFISPNLKSKGKTLNNFYSSFSPSQRGLNKTNNLPTLTFDKSRKVSFKKIDKLKNYERMRKYRVKLKKTKKVDNNEDNLFKFLHENGLHYSFSSNKYFIGDKYGYYSKYLPSKFKMNFSTTNILKNNSSNTSKNGSNVDASSINSKKNSKQRNISNQGLFYSTTEEDDDDRMTFKKYMKLQSIADIRFRPRLGDTSIDLINYIKKIDNIRKGVVNDLIKQINNVENRYNKENPKEDSKFSTKMQGLYHHKWKNIFSLRDYQGLFSGNLKGKISSQNYDVMSKNFRDIFFMCFSNGSPNYTKVKPFQI